MGYFNIFYKITRIIDMLTRKRNRRAIMVILIIIAVIFILHNKGYCAQEDTTYTTDTSYFMIERYQGNVNAFVVAFDKYYNNDSTATNVFNTIFESIQRGQFLYFYQQTLGGNISIFTYDRTTSKSYVDTSLVYNDGTRVPSTAYNLTWLTGNRNYFINLTPGDYAYYIGTSNPSTSDINYTIPYILLYRTPIEIVNCMERAGYGYNGETINIQTKLNQIYNRLDTTNDKLEGINDSLTDESYDESAVDFDTSSVDNVSDTEIQGLFSGVIGSFQNSLASYGGTITKIIPLPHGGQLEIPSNIVSSHLGNLSALVEAFWYFVFGIYLFRFVSNLIHKIKSGDILNGYTNDNEIITSSML